MCSNPLRYDDGDCESNVRRENIRTKDDLARSAAFLKTPIFSKWQDKGISQVHCIEFGTCRRSLSVERLCRACMPRRSVAAGVRKT